MTAKSYGCYIALFCFFLAFFIFFSNGHYGGDGLENYLTAESIVLDGDIAIHDRPFGINQMRYEPRGVAGAGQKTYSGYGIGMPLLIVPFYFTGHILSRFLKSIPHDYITQFTVSLINPIITALIALLLFIFLKKINFKIKTCFLTTLCYGMCTMGLAYTRSGFSEPAVTLLVFLAMFFIFNYEKTGHSGYIFTSGLLVGFSLLIKDGALLYLPLFFLYIIGKTPRMVHSPSRLIKLWIAALAPVSICLLLYCINHTFIRSAAITSQKSEGIISIFKGTMMLKGLYYYLASPGKGYFFYNLPLLLALFAIKDTFLKKYKPALFCTVFIMANLLFYSYIFKRGSLFSWGPRYLYPTIPFMCIFFAQFVENAVSKFKKGIIATFCFLGFSLQIPCLFVNFSNYIFFVKEKLGLPEYFINFMPELSPIRGGWVLLLSALNKVFTGVSLNFKYDPDWKFISAIAKNLQSYDIWDIWWVNILSIAPQLAPLVIAAVLFLLVILVTSFINIKRSILGTK